MDRHTLFPNHQKCSKPKYLKNQYIYAKGMQNIFKNGIIFGRKRITPIMQGAQNSKFN